MDDDGKKLLMDTSSRCCLERWRCLSTHNVKQIRILIFQGEAFHMIVSILIIYHTKSYHLFWPEAPLHYYFISISSNQPSKYALLITFTIIIICVTVSSFMDPPCIISSHADMVIHDPEKVISSLGQKYRACSLMIRKCSRNYNVYSQVALRSCSIRTRTWTKTTRTPSEVYHLMLCKAPF